MPTGLRYVLMPSVAPLEAVTPRDSLQLDVQIPPGVVTISPPVSSADIPGAPVSRMLGSNGPFAQSQITERDRFVSLAEFGGTRLDL